MARKTKADKAVVVGIIVLCLCVLLLVSPILIAWFEITFGPFDHSIVHTEFSEKQWEAAQEEWLMLDFPDEAQPIKLHIGNGWQDPNDGCFTVRCSHESMREALETAENWRPFGNTEYRMDDSMYLYFKTDEDGEYIYIQFFWNPVPENVYR